MDYHEYLLRYTESVWSNENPEAAMSFFLPGARIHGLGSDDSLSPEDMVTFVRALFMLMETPRFDTLHIVAQDNLVSYVVRCESVSRRTGETIEITGQIMLRIEDGLIAEAYNHFDMIGFFSKIGVLPPDLLESALAGAVAA